MKKLLFTFMILFAFVSISFAGGGKYGHGQKPFLTGCIVDGFSNMTGDSLTVIPNPCSSMMFLDSIRIVSTTTGAEFILRACDIDGGVHTVIGSITTSTATADGKYKGFLSSFTSNIIPVGHKLYVLKTVASVDNAEFYVWPR